MNASAYAFAARHPGTCYGPACLNPACLPPASTLRLIDIDGAAVQRANDARSTVIGEARAYAESVHAPQSLRDAFRTYDLALSAAGVRR